MADSKYLVASILLGSALLSGLFTEQAHAEDTQQAALMARGAYLATAGDCVACHTRPGGKPFAGGLEIATPKGVVVSTNITPDPQNGIGTYTQEDFEKALRRGLRKDGAYLYPVMPYVSYAGLTDQDVKALYTWFMHGVQPVADKPPETQMAFPGNIRMSMMAWNMLAESEKPEMGDSATYDKLRRGRYLATALEHCGTCHTPRNFMLVEQQDQYLAGSQLNGWFAPNITSSSTGGIGDWSEDDLVAYLKTGHAKGRSQAAGPMGEAVEHSTSHLTEADLHALAAFIKQVPAHDDAVEHQARDSFGQAAVEPDLRSGVVNRVDNQPDYSGAELYDANCAACHGVNGAGTADQYVPSLFANSVVGAGRSDNLIMTILEGVNRSTPSGHASMPAFGAHSDVQRLSDKDVARLVNYLTDRFGSGDHHVTAEQVGAARPRSSTPATPSDATKPVSAHAP
ncbi:c-type cytochrome [Acetobacter syzygii]|uniref:Sorbitol dehydrogenase n=1 Tax=Acetobacter syzygii TaxID=146476 RepID=A0A270BWH4_9PROT|nr:cytochrome c [Acetobacter syzygii]PAL26930.1 sorbitol dehydrogenase [Acetobacter syzygii]PAL29353.1 sorbitol dehydrogenase [Acetobacter syzygii]